MRRLIYISKSQIGANPKALDRIVEQSSIRNAEAHVTGMLWSDGVSFVQVLEGDHAAVGATMERVGSDPRHDSIDVVSDREVTTRMFGGWAMRSADTEPASINMTAFLVGYAARENPASVRRLMDVISASGG